MHQHDHHGDRRASAYRRIGYRTALEKAGLPLRPELEAEGDFTFRSGEAGARQLLSGAVPPTAIFASNDDMAAATVAVVHRRGLDVPGDLTVCGFDDSAVATTIWPELTTIRQPIADMSRAAVQLLATMLFDRREAGSAGERGEPKHVTLDYTLVLRRSDAAPLRRPSVRGR